jgi:hypothetical protein
MTTHELLGRHDKFLDSLIDGYEEQLDPLIAAAQKRTLQILESKLTFDTSGNIEYTPANQHVLRSINRLFKIEMNRSTKAAPGGYKGLAQNFSDMFADHLPQFQDVLNQINASVVAKNGGSLPKVKFTAGDVDLFAAQAAGAKDMLDGVLDQTANAAKRQALFAVGGLKFSELAVELAEQFHKTKAQAVSMADTSVSMFYRTIASQSYKKIEEGLPQGAVAYEYAGPDDSITRDFCEDMLDKSSAQPMTREEIEAEDNGQIPNSFLSGGGYNCRHQWILSFADEDQDKGADTLSAKANLASDSAEQSGTEEAHLRASELHRQAATAHEALT